MKNDPRILVAMGLGANGEPPTVILGMTDATWADIEGGKAQDIDLVPLGIRAQLLIMRGTDHDDIKRRLQDAAGELQMPVGGLADLSVASPKTN